MKSLGVRSIAGSEVVAGRGSAERGERIFAGALRVSPRRATSPGDPLHVLPHPFAPALAPEAALAIAAESRRRVEQIRRVHPHHAGLDLRRDVEREVDALRPHARRETVRRVVRERDRFFRRAEGHRHQHRPEDLDLRDRRRRLHVGEQRRRIEAAFGRTRPRRLPHRRAFSRRPAGPDPLMRSSCTGATIAPMSTALSSGEPTRSFSIRARSFATSRSATPSCTSRREPAQHTWP